MQNQLAKIARLAPSCDAVASTLSGTQERTSKQQSDRANMTIEISLRVAMRIDGAVAFNNIILLRCDIQMT